MAGAGRRRGVGAGLAAARAAGRREAALAAGPQGPSRSGSRRKGAATGRKLAAVANDLERRLLARSYTEHTPSGHHARFLETWAAWAGRHGIATADLPDAADALQALSAPVIAWARREPAAGPAPVARRPMKGLPR